MEVVSCAVCNSSDLEEISTQAQFNIEAHVCVCNDCGLSFLSPRWDKATYLDFYINKYDHYYRENPSKLPAEKDPFSYYPIIKRIEKSLANTNTPSKILDIGSGDGSKLESIQKAYPEAAFFAIEPSGTLQKELTKRNITFVSNDIETTWESQYQNFDFIIMRHVLEHMLDPISVLKKLHNVMADNGIIYIAVPNALNLDTPLTSFFFRAVHTYYFSPLSITNILKKAGFEIIDIKPGDENLKNELFLFAKKSNISNDLVINKQNATEQIKSYKAKLKEENSLPFKIKLGITSLFNFIIKTKKAIFKTGKPNTDAKH